MAKKFPPLPPRDQLRFADGNLVIRWCEAEDAQAVFDLLTNPRLPFILEIDRPESVEHLRAGFARLSEPDAPAKRFWFVVESDGRTVGWIHVRLDFRNKDGGIDGLTLRTMVGGLAYLDPDALGQGIGHQLLEVINGPVEEFFVRYFGVEQIIAWIDDTNEMAKGMAAAGGFEGPINHDHAAGLGLYRRKPRW